MTEQQTTTDGLQQIGTSTSAAPRRWRSALLVGLFVLISAGGYWFGASQIVPPTENPCLYVAAQHLNFGEVWMEDDFQWELPIVNPTTRDIAVHQLVTSCGCIAVEPESFVVPAQGLTTVNLALDLRPTQPVERNDASRAFEVTIVAVTDQMVHKRLTWALRGQVRTPFMLSEDYVDFEEDMLIFGTKFPTKSLMLHCAYPMTQVVASTSDSSLAMASINEEGEGGSRKQLLIIPQQDAPVGRHELVVRLNAIAVDGEAIPPFEIPVVMPVVQDIFAVPSHIQVGELAVSMTASQVVLLASRTNGRFEVVGVETPPSTGIAVKPVDVTAEDAMGFQVQQTGIASGDQQHQVRFLVRRHGEQETLQVDVPISYFGRPRPDVTHPH